MLAQKAIPHPIVERFTPASPSRPRGVHHACSESQARSDLDLCVAIPKRVASLPDTFDQSQEPSPPFAEQPTPCEGSPQRAYRPTRRAPEGLSWEQDAQSPPMFRRCLMSEHCSKKERQARYRRHYLRKVCQERCRAAGESLWALLAAPAEPIEVGRDRSSSGTPEPSDSDHHCGGRSQRDTQARSTKQPIRTAKQGKSSLRLSPFAVASLDSL